MGRFGNVWGVGGKGVDHFWINWEVKGKEGSFFNLIRLVEGDFFGEIENLKWWLGDDSGREFVFFDCENSRMI